MAYNNPPYYMTAYSLAVKQGFQGSLDEWLQSLKGETGQYVPDNEDQLQSFLNLGYQVMVTKSIELTRPIVINRSKTTLAFSASGMLTVNGAFSAIQLKRTEEGKKLSWVRIEGAKLIGSWSLNNPAMNGSVGIEIQGLGYNNHINFAEIQGFEYGIQVTGEFDCGQQNAMYEPYILGCRYGIDDRNCGLQNIRVFGGRIENNREWGAVIASPNVAFIGTMLQGNDLGEVKFVNTLVNTEVYRDVPKSGGVFTNCYFEHASRYERDEQGNFLLDENGQRIPVYEKDENGEFVLDADGNKILARDSVIQLGDADQGDGWFGHLSLMGCKIGHFNHYVIRCNGRGAIVGDKPEKNLQTIQMHGCTCNGEQVFYLPKLNFGCRLLMTGHNQGQTKRIETDVNPEVTMQYINGTASRLGAAQVSGITGHDFVPMAYAHTRMVRLEPFQYETDEEGNFVLDENGKLVSNDRATGVWLTQTVSPAYPWEDSNTGINKGCLHYCSAPSGDERFKSPGWFIRTHGPIRDGENYIDSADNWSSLVTADAYGVFPYFNTRDVRIESTADGHGSFVTVTNSSNLPWEEERAGSHTGSMHFSNVVGSRGWYIRMESKGSEDSESKWRRIVMADAGGTMINTLTKKLMIVSPEYTSVDITNASALPWEYESAGRRKGSLHYSLAANTWYQRNVNFTDGDSDAEENWSPLSAGGGQGISAEEKSILFDLLSSAYYGESDKTAQLTKLANMWGLTYTPPVSTTAELDRAKLGSMLLE